MGKLTEPTTYKKYSKSDYVTSEDLNSKEFVVTILRVEEKAVKNGDDNIGTLKAILILAEFKKPMVLNATNYKRIKKMYKEADLSKWANYKVTLYVEHGIKAFGDVVDGLRVKTSIPKAKILPALNEDAAAWQSYVDYMVKGGSIDEVKKKVTLTKKMEDLLCLPQKK